MLPRRLWPYLLQGLVCACAEIRHTRQFRVVFIIRLRVKAMGILTPPDARRRRLSASSASHGRAPKTEPHRDEKGATSRSATLPSVRCAGTVLFLRQKAMLSFPNSRRRSLQAALPTFPEGPVFAQAENVCLFREKPEAGLSPEVRRPDSKTPERRRSAQTQSISAPPGFPALEALPGGASFQDA